MGIYDEIRKAKLNKPMGSAILEIGEILGSRGNLKAKKLNKGGTLFCRITAAPSISAGTLYLSLRGVGLKNVDGLFGKSDPFVELSTQANVAGGMTWQTLFRSKHIDNDLNPIWEPFAIDLNRLLDQAQNSTTTNNGTQTKQQQVQQQDPKQQPIKISVFDWEKSGKHKSLGQFETTVQALLDAETPGASGPYKDVNLSKAFILHKKTGGGAGSRKEFGKVVVVRAVLEGDGDDNDNDKNKIKTESTTTTMTMPTPIPVPMTGVGSTYNKYNTAYNNNKKPSFVDYLTGGCELEMSIAIDFTGSNGDPRRPGTLHYISPHGQTLNDYEKAFTSVGSIMERYDTNKQFPVYGFGAKFGGLIHHCFQVGNKMELNGLGEALQAYRNVFTSGLTMSGPTVFAEVIDMAAARARSAQEKAEQQGQQSYGLLLILTDGAVSDIGLTQVALRNASDAPLSIVIVGVGNADFSRMQFLDDFANNNNTTTDGGNQRDIVQFVEFNKFVHDKSALTRETLDELPNQLVDYFYTCRGIMPLAAIRESQVLNTITPDEADEEDIDLTIEYKNNNDDEEEEIILDSNATNAVPMYDDTQYGTTAAFLVPAVPIPTVDTPPRPPTAMVPPTSTTTTTTSVTNAAVPPYNPMSSATAPPPLQASRNNGPNYNNNNNMPAFSQALDLPSPQQQQQQNVFHVQVPPGVSAGQTLEVKNPRTHQHMLVTVPFGISAGGRFAVAY